MKRILLLVLVAALVSSPAWARKPAKKVAVAFETSGASPLDVPAPDPATVTIWLQNETTENLSFQYGCDSCGCEIGALKYCGPLPAQQNCTTHPNDPLPCNARTVLYGVVRIKSPSGHNLKVNGELLPGYQFGGNAPRDIWRYHVAWQ